MATLEGDFRTPSGRFALVAARFNAFIVEHLVQGARDGLQRHGVSVENIDQIYVPGSLEIPVAVKHLLEHRQYAAVICLGAVIRGETDHCDIVASESAKGLALLGQQTGVPIINAILTTNTVEQAVNRAGAKQGNKGFDAAVAAIEMVNLLEQIRQPSP